MRAYCLSIHAGYRCAHVGACCTAGWPIPIEPDLAHALRGRASARDGIIATGDAGATRFMARKTSRGACVFYEGGLCTIQRDAGAELMPSPCRNFPRVTLRDGRGMFVTLSHYCPTAARLLLSGGPLAIVEAPSSISLHGTADGLDATGVLPPLLRPGMLMDLEGYDAWEHAGVAVLGNPTYSAREAIAIIAQATQDVQAWSPGDEALAVRVAAAFDRARQAHRPENVRTLSVLEASRKAFLAAHLFASWEAYQPGSCLMAVVEALDIALSLVGQDHPDEDAFIAAVRRTDLRLRHTPRHASQRN